VTVTYWTLGQQISWVVLPNNYPEASFCGATKISRHPVTFWQEKKKKVGKMLSGSKLCV
jgi:hypothetical protein